MSKVVAIDARMITPGAMHGIARYVYHLLQSLRALDVPFRVVAIVSRDCPLYAEAWPEHITLVSSPTHWISFREQWSLPRLLKRLKADLLHCPSFVAPINCPCNLVMTIHDLNHLVLPEFYTPVHQLYYRTFVQHCIRNSKHLLTVSEFSKQEIVKHLHVAPEKISVTYNGVSDNFAPVADPLQRQYIREIYELPHDFVLCLSNNKPHKNLYQLVRAYCYSDVEIPLVIASSSIDARLIQLAERYGKKHQVFFSRFISEEHLPAVYSMARVFIYPSTYEGFGLPPLEALACGCRVIVSKTSSLPEVVGKHAVFVDPLDYRDIARALDAVVSVETDCNSSRDQRILHARSFSWQAMAEHTVELYKQFLL